MHVCLYRAHRPVAPTGLRQVPAPLIARTGTAVPGSQGLSSLVTLFKSNFSHRCPLARYGRIDWRAHCAAKRRACPLATQCVIPGTSSSIGEIQVTMKWSRGEIGEHARTSGTRHGPQSVERYPRMLVDRDTRNKQVRQACPTVSLT